MTKTKSTVSAASRPRWNEDVQKVLNVARSSVTTGQDVHVELCTNGLAVIKSGMKSGVTNGTRMILDILFESIVVCENGWMVACKHGIYYLYNKEGNMYKGLSFLKKENAIRFAKTL